MTVQEAAATLADAAKTGVTCPPVRDLLPDVAAAYAAQDVNIEAALDAGAKIVGRKIGLTSLRVQAQLGVDQPDYGALLDINCITSGGEVSPGLLIQPRVEAEVVVVLEHDLVAERHTVLDLIKATAYVLPAIEIVDSRIADWDITIIDTVADNASSGLFVLGTRPVRLADVDLPSVAMQLSLDGESASTGTGAECLGNPLIAAVWVADKMAAAGTPLRAGECILTGALGPMVSVVHGGAVEVTIEGLGSVSVRIPAVGA